MEPFSNKYMMESKEGPADFFRFESYVQIDRSVTGDEQQQQQQ